MKSTSLLRVLPTLCLLLLGACATPLKQEQLVPKTTTVAAHATGKHIQVDPVIVADVPKPSWTEPQWQRLDQDIFTKAIVDTLDRSGLFSAVGITGPADYRLSAKVVDQRLVGTMSNIMLLLVRYQLVDTPSGNILWTENLLSFHHLSASDVFMGTDRVAQVVETAVRENLSQLLENLSRRIAIPAGYTTETPVKGGEAMTSFPEKITVESEKQVIEKKPEPVSPYPRKLTGKEIDAHFLRYRTLTFDRAPKVDFTIKRRPKGYVERICPECTMDHGIGTMHTKVSQGLVCFDWDQVSYPSSTCFELMQIEKNRYQLVDPVDGETYGYVVND